MANRTDQITHDPKYFDHLFEKAYPTAPPGIQEWIRDTMLPNGDVSMESVLETAIAKQNNIKKYSTEGYDFLNKDGTPGGDAKKASVRESTNRPRLEAKISDIKNKIGDLYICVYEPLLDKFYYFSVPYDRHHKYKVLSIYFELDGSPRRNQIRLDYKPPLWEYEVESIAHLYRENKEVILIEEEVILQ